ncbi:MAG: hypothetical protein ACI9V8_002243 [Urechidicola sp.]
MTCANNSNKAPTAQKLRRIALNQQGLLKADSFGRGKQATLRAIEQIGYVQIDTISVVERAHHHVLWSRVSNYKSQYLTELVAERQLFEYWSHAAAWLPMKDYRFSLPRMKQANGDRNWFGDCDKKLIQQVLLRVQHEGALLARDFEDTRKGKKEWWDLKPAKRALEQLFMQGELMVTRREGFQKVYDLPERIIPDWVDTTEPTLEEYADYLIDNTIRAHGFATTKSMAYLRKGKPLRHAIDLRLQVKLEDGQVLKLELDNDNDIYVLPELLDRPAPRSNKFVRILSPFDNAIIQRQRGQNIFQFNYQIECYLPAPKRQFGYFCLPILYGDQFVARADCKAHRKQGMFEIKSLHYEPEFLPNEDFTQAFSSAIDSFSKFNGCSDIAQG